MSDTNNTGRIPSTIVFGLYGVGGFAREVMPFATDYLPTVTRADQETTLQMYFIETHPQSTEANGRPIISEDAFFNLICSERYFNIAISDSQVRKKLATHCIAKGATPVSIHSRDSIIYDNNELGEGAIICAYSIVTSNSRIGKFFHSNIYSYVGHDCVIGDFVTFGPNVHCNGNIHIGDHAYIGTGAMLKQGTASKPLVIGENSIVGMGAVVTKDVPPNTTVVGNPAKPLRHD